MTRGIGVGEWLAALPEWLVALAAVLTQLGDLWFVTLVVASGYWLGRHAPVLGDAVARERMAAVLVAVLLGIVFTETLKVVFGLDRPPWAVAEPTLGGLSGLPATVYAWIAGAEGYGFPSGHAIATTVTWGGLAWAIRAGRRRHRYAVAATVVAVVCLTRLVLGAHYLVDVLAGVGVGLLLLLVVLRRWGWPLVPLGLAVLGGALSVALAGPTTDAAGVAGLAVGVAAGWAVGGPAAVATESTASARAARVTAGIGVAVVLPPVGLAVVGSVPPLATFVVATAAGAALVVLPLVGERIEKIV